MSKVSPVTTRLTTIQANRERLASLGTMAAGLAHELNNPAAAAKRAASSLVEALNVTNHAFRTFVESGIEREEAATLLDLQKEAIERSEEREALDPIAASDAEDAMLELLEDMEIREPWRLAEPLSYLDKDWLDRVQAVAGPVTGKALHWVSAAVTAKSLAEELVDSTSRMSTLVAAVKTYAYMDRGGLITADVHEGLESTIVMMGHKLKHTKIKLVRSYDKTLPKLTMHGSELNQVWTNLIHNAIQALGETGTITIRTSRDGDCVKVDIGDDGPGIPGRRQGAHLRAVLHHQGGRQRHRPRPGHLPPHHRGAPPRLDLLRQRSRRDRLPCLAPLRRNGTLIWPPAPTWTRSRSPSCRESTDGCEDCLRMGGKWLHLRICLECGHVGCCDSSPNKHATAHAHGSGHQIIRSLEPGEDWCWCYADELGMRIRRSPARRGYRPRLWADSRSPFRYVRAVTDPLGMTPDEMRALGHRVVDLLVDRLADPSVPALRRATPEEMRARLAEPAPAEPRARCPGAPRRRCAALHVAVRSPALLRVHPDVPDVPGRVGDFIASALNVYAGSWMEAAGPSQVELTVLDWFKDWLGYDGGRRRAAAQRRLGGQHDRARVRARGAASGR
jgi:signal transduction histidine kinase